MPSEHGMLVTCFFLCTMEYGSLGLYFSIVVKYQTNPLYRLFVVPVVPSLPGSNIHSVGKKEKKQQQQKKKVQTSINTNNDRPGTRSSPER